MITEVYTSTHPPCKPVFCISGVIRLVIQLSVPSSVVAKGIIINSNIIKTGLPVDLTKYPKTPTINKVITALTIYDQPKRLPI